MFDWFHGDIFFSTERKYVFYKDDIYQIIPDIIMGVVPGRITGIGGTAIPKLTGLTRHGLERALAKDGVGVSEKAILETLKTPPKYQQGNNTFRFESENAVVVLIQ